MNGVWTDSDRRAWGRTLATCAKLRERIARYKAMAPHMPQFAEMVRELEAKWQHCLTLAEVAVATDTPDASAPG